MNFVKNKKYFISYQNTNDRLKSALYGSFRERFLTNAIRILRLFGAFSLFLFVKMLDK